MSLIYCGLQEPLQKSQNPICPRFIPAARDNESIVVATILLQTSSGLTRQAIKTCTNGPCSQQPFHGRPSEWYMSNRLTKKTSDMQRPRLALGDSGIKPQTDQGILETQHGSTMLKPIVFLSMFWRPSHSSMQTGVDYPGPQRVNHWRVSLHVQWLTWRLYQARSLVHGKLSQACGRADLYATKVDAPGLMLRIRSSNGTTVFELLLIETPWASFNVPQTISGQTIIIYHTISHIITLNYYRSGSTWARTIVL